MSRYGVDKALRAMAYGEGEIERFQADRRGYLEGFPLSEDERAALAAGDHVALYAAGAHPFLLWNWVCALRPGVDRHEFSRQYAQSVAHLGRPYFGA